MGLQPTFLDVAARDKSTPDNYMLTYVFGNTKHNTLHSVK